MTSFGFVSTFPPTVCGLATFTDSLRTALTEGGRDTDVVVRVVDAPQDAAAPGVAVELAPADASALAEAAARLNRCDVVVLQHEYGIYGGRDGDEVLALLDRVLVPTIVVLHTVLSAPTAHQRSVLEDVIGRADRVVVMTRSALDRLGVGYRVDLSRISVIPHGSPDMRGPAPDASRTDPRFLALTWGLLGPGKGLEWAVDAMTLLRDDDPSPRYVIAGRTHPRVLEHSGEAYRESLQARVARAKLSSVTFDSHYRDPASLATLVRSADAVLLPYDSTEQVTSGVLTEAVAAGKPVIATRFPHACELLADGGGILVPHRDPAAIAAALRSLVRASADPSPAPAPAMASSLLWSNVAQEYRRLARELADVAVPVGA